MNTHEAIFSRRSIRVFKDQPIEREKIIRYLEAANTAPSAGNNQPWLFYVIKKNAIDKLKDIIESSLTERKDYNTQDFRDRLDKMSVPEIEGDKLKGMKAFFRSLGNAPVAIIVTVEANIDPWKDFINTQDAAAAIQNLILSAWDDGVGSCWMCGPLHKSINIKEALRLPEKQKLIAIIPLGYPETIPPAPPKKDTSEITIWID